MFHLPRLLFKATGVTKHRLIDFFFLVLKLSLHWGEVWTAVGT